MEPSTKLMILGGLSSLILICLFLFDLVLEALIFVAGLCLILMVFPGLTDKQRILAAVILGVDVMLLLYKFSASLK